MREQEKLWRERVKERGRKQISVWLDGDTYQALQALIQAHNLRGIGDAIRLLVDNHQAGQNAPQAASEPELTEDATDAPVAAQAPMIERQSDTHRCECRTSSGGRCRNKTVAIIKVRVGSQIAEFGRCKRHVRHFEPFS